MINSTSGRRLLFGLILTGFMSAFLILWLVSRGGAATFESVAPVISKLLSHYVPLLALLAGFYFSERESLDQGQATSVEALVLAALLTGSWAFAPPILLFASDTLQAAI